MEYVVADLGRAEILSDSFDSVFISVFSQISEFRVEIQEGRGPAGVDEDQDRDRFSFWD